MTSERDRSAEDWIRDGREQYASKRYKPALESFTKAMKRCPCTKDMKRERCTCKDYEKAAAEGRSIFNEALYHCKCEVGKTFDQCDNKQHIQALDYRAATFEAMGELDRARRDADWMLELAPRLPDGYLRLGKILRLQKKKEFAWRVYSGGIEATATPDNANDDPKVKQLYLARQPLHIRYARHDPILLPLDIVRVLVAELDFVTLVRCIGVSKAWRDALTSGWNSQAWKDLSFPALKGNRRPPTDAALIRLLGYSGHQVRHISIRDADKFRLSQKKFQAILGAARRLEHLEIHGSHNKLDATSAVLPSLKRLVLLNNRPPRSLLHHVDATLESLHLSLPVGRQVSEKVLLGPPLSKLKYFRLEYPECYIFEFDTIMRKMPNLEQLCLVRAIPSAFLMEIYPHFPWAKLKAVVALEMGFYQDVMQVALSRLISVCGGDSLRHLEVTSSGTHVEVDDESWLDYYNHGPDTMELDNIYKRIEAFRTRNIVIYSARCRQRVRHSLEEGRLHSIDIVFNQPPLNESPEGITSKARLESFEWLRGSTAIRSLGLFNFRFTRLPRNAEDLPLLDFVASFPNLEVLDINSEHYDSAELSSVIVDIIKIAKMKKIYQATVKGVQLDKLKAVAKSANVELIWGERPVLWPVPLENP